jgi:transposase
LFLSFAPPKERNQRKGVRKRQPRHVCPPATLCLNGATKQAEVRTFSGLPSLEEMIDPNHAVRFVNQVIDNLDIDALIRKDKGGGCSSYHPRLLLKLLVYGYLTNQYSSRKIEQAAKQNVYFMWLSSMSYPV